MSRFLMDACSARGEERLVVVVGPGNNIVKEWRIKPERRGEERRGGEPRAGC